MNKLKLNYLIALLCVFIIVVFLRNYFLKKEQLFEILAFSVADSIDSTIHVGGVKPFSRSDHFLVVGFESYEKNLNQIDSFICFKSPEIDSILKKYSNYTIYFFKKSRITNNEHIKIHERDYDEYSLFFDYICRYSWLENRFLGRFDPKYRFATDTLICN